MDTTEDNVVIAEPAASEVVTVLTGSIPEPAAPASSPSLTKLATIEKEVALLELHVHSPSDGTEIQEQSSSLVALTPPSTDNNSGPAQSGQVSGAVPKQPHTGDYLPLEDTQVREDTASPTKEQEPSTPEKHHSKRKKKKKHSSRPKDDSLMDSSSDSHSDRLSEQINNAATRAITNGRYIHVHVYQTIA